MHGEVYLQFSCCSNFASGICLSTNSFKKLVRMMIYYCAVQFLIYSFFKKKKNSHLFISQTVNYYLSRQINVFRSNYKLEKYFRARDFR